MAIFGLQIYREKYLNSTLQTLRWTDLGNYLVFFKSFGAGRMRLDKHWRYCTFNNYEVNDYPFRNGYPFDDYDCTNIIYSFITIAEFSFRTGHSTRLMQFMLDGMSSAQLARVQNRLSMRLEFLTSRSRIREPWHTPIANIAGALQWVRGVERPFRLQHLARCSFARSSYGKCLPTTVKFPVRLRRYLAYY